MLEVDNLRFEFFSLLTHLIMDFLDMELLCFIEPFLKFLELLGEEVLFEV